MPKLCERFAPMFLEVRDEVHQDHRILVRVGPEGPALSWVGDDGVPLGEVALSVRRGKVHVQVFDYGKKSEEPVTELTFSGKESKAVITFEHELQKARQAKSN